MRVLITGAAGFLGRNVLLAMPHDWQVVALHRPGQATLPAFVAAHGLRHVQPVACDLADGAQVARAVDAAGRHFDCCLYLAANTSIPDSIQRPLDDLTMNVVGLLNTLENWTCEHLIFFSSGAVYLGRDGGVGPGQPLTPTLPYAIAKLAAEHYIGAYAVHRGSPARATILRFFGAFGPYEPSRKLYTRLVRRFAFERDPRYCVTGDGENYIDAMYVDDAMRALLAVIAAPPAGVHTVDLGVGGRESVNQVVRRAARVFGLEAQISHQGVSPEYIAFAPDPLPFAAQYGFVPIVSLEEGFRRLADHLRGQDSQEGHHV